jgi:hypothetical protein
MNFCGTHSSHSTSIFEILKKIRGLEVPSRILIISTYLEMRGTKDAPLRCQAVLYLAASWSVEIYTQDVPCCLHFSRTGPSSLENMLIDLSWPEQYFPDSGVKPQCFTDKTKWSWNTLWEVKAVF